MQTDSFQTPAGQTVPAVTASEMARVDRIAVEAVGLELLQMMENAGRGLARQVRREAPDSVLVLAGGGGNGGGGMAAARHLANRGLEVTVGLDRDPEALEGAPAVQHRILSAMDVELSSGASVVERSPAEAVVVDALVGYGLDGELRGTAASFVDALADDGRPVLSLDVPSGLDATTGEVLGRRVYPDRTVTLALPKTGLAAVDSSLVLVDIGIPRVVYRRAGIEDASPFGDEDWVELT